MKSSTGTSPRVLAGSRASDRRADRLAAGLARCEECFHTSIETLIDPFVLLRPVRDGAGAIVDFVYEYANDAACETNVPAREELVGMRVNPRMASMLGYAPEEMLGREGRGHVRARR